jgi:hypothetical protein
MIQGGPKVNADHAGGDTASSSPGPGSASANKKLDRGWRRAYLFGLERFWPSTGSIDRKA